MHFSQKPRAIMGQRVPLWVLQKLNKLFVQPERAPVARKKIQFFATEQTHQSQTLFYQDQWLILKVLQVNSKHDITRG